MATASIDPQHLLTRHNYSAWVKHIISVLECEGLQLWIELDSKPKDEAVLARKQTLQMRHFGLNKVKVVQLV